jgi:hypothetical protein
MLQGVLLASIPIGGGRSYERHRCLASPAHLAEVRSHAVADAAERGRGAELMNVPRALLRDPAGLRQNCRTANGELADMRLQTGDKASSAGLDARAKGMEISAAIPLRSEPFPERGLLSLMRRDLLIFAILVILVILAKRV